MPLNEETNQTNTTAIKQFTAHFASENIKYVARLEILFE